MRCPILFRWWMPSDEEDSFTPLFQMAGTNLLAESCKKGISKMLMSIKKWRGP